MVSFVFCFFIFSFFFLLLIGKFINWLWFPVIFIFSHQLHYPEKNLLFIYFFSSFYTKMAAELKYIGGSTPFYLFLALLSKFDPKYKLFKSIITYMIVWIQWFINKSQLKKKKTHYCDSIYVHLIFIFKKICFVKKNANLILYFFGVMHVHSAFGINFAGRLRFVIGC